MAVVIQSLSSAVTASQSAGLETVVQSAGQTESELPLPSTVVVLGSTSVVSDLYNATGAQSTTTVSANAAADAATATQASVTTTVIDTNAANSAVAATLEAMRISENSAVLAATLATQLASNTTATSAERTTTNAALAATDARLATTEINTESSRLLAVSQLANATRSTNTLNQLLSANIAQARVESVVTGGQNDLGSTSSAATNLPLTQTSGAVTTASSIATGSIPATSESTLVADNTTTNIKPDSTLTPALASQNSIASPLAATTIPSPALTQTLAKETVAETSLLPATTTTTTVVASNATAPPVSTPEVSNSPVSNFIVDSGTQAVVTVAQNPAYANLIAGYYTSMAASSAQPPTATIIPIRPGEIQPAIAISAINSLSQLGGQSGRDGNPGMGYRQRRSYFSYVQDRY